MIIRQDNYEVNLVPILSSILLGIYTHSWVFGFAVLFIMAQVADIGRALWNK